MKNKAKTIKNIINYNKYVRIYNWPKNTQTCKYEIKENNEKEKVLIYKNHTQIINKLYDY